ncbi:YidC/Oxa1 family insertase periplasmic-domain containing protein [Algisphaera agarilytica]|uniref:Membrane protein insertase YidC n=1 Tax=Algisphaera agarilytica TaxID=1385975 RepID=A0A7X0H2Z1_9BACT|nr:YidC/Oxa1 family insertase periplasmic-domain containing protein [Algisphaera agarilytica]MBB6428224.1 YidC/Oxa1 family membrane protein insertase [Algisphaera agarilytica]
MRLLVPIVAILIGLAFAFAIATGRSGTDAPPIPADDETTEQVASAEDAPEAADQPEADPGDQPEQAAPTEGATPDPAVELAGLKAVPTDSPQAPALGATSDESPFKFRIEFTSYGAGLKKITLTDYDQFVDPPKEGEAKPAYHLMDVNQGVAEGAAPAFYPYAAQAVTINGQSVRLDGVQWAADDVVRGDASHSVTYRLPVVGADDQLVAEVVRTWTASADSYDLSLKQQILNHTDAPLEVSFQQYAQGDVLTDLGAYLGDRRMFITGHFRDEKPPKFGIYVDDSFIPRNDLIKQKRTLWPNEDLPVRKNPRLAWLAAENRYFAVITHAPVPESATVTADVPELDGTFPAVSYRVLDQEIDMPQADKQRIAVQLGSAAHTVAPGSSLALDLAVYAGPRKKAVLDEAPYSLMHFDKLIRYELGCTWCTFQWLAKGLLGYLKGLNWLVKDWGIAIIILVLTVRLLLHPITKRAQTNMMKMSKQMGKLQPEMATLKEKYKDDPTALNRETMKLYREAGINPANMLGCLPMLLQTPIWIALYAMLYFAIELRHEPAFYGVFQSISGGAWHFLEDLSVSDNFIRFIPPEQPAYKLTWLPFIEPEFRSLNVLPLLMAVVFFFQMKLTTPPPQTDQQRQQQMIMKFMPFMFPIFLYSAPAGLTLYICCSTFAGIVDSYIVRKHVREQEEAGTLFEKKPVKPGGFRDRMQKRFEMAAQMAAERQAEIEKQKKASGGGNKNYKKRK